MDQLKLTEMTIGEIVSEDYRTAQVFKKHGLDFCCGGKRTVAEACEKKGVDRSVIEEELNMLDEKRGTADNYKEWSPGFLVDYIINNHHNYVREKLPEILSYARKLAKVHGERHPESTTILDKFTILAGELQRHLQKEENILFPYIKELESASPGDPYEEPVFGTAENPIAMMEEEHDEAGGLMEEINQLTSGYAPPEDACATHRVLYANLEEFENDLHKHIHLENNILFPKALRMEKQRKEGATA